MKERVDSWFQRRIYETKGLRELMDYQKTPMVDAGDLTENEVGFPEGFDLLRHLPFDQYVIHSTSKALIGEASAPVNVKVITSVDRPRKPINVGGEEFRDPIYSRQGILIVDDDHMISVDVIVDLEALTSGGRMTYCEVIGGMHGRQFEKHTSEAMVLSCCATIAYTSSRAAGSDRHMVEVSNQLSAARGSNTAKPWTRTDLPSIILIRLDEAQRYGHRADRGGTHASPRPHQRRGHWRNLRAEKFKDKRNVWVKPAWIGDQEWVFEGNTYRLIEGRDRPEQPQEVSDTRPPLDCQST